MAKGYNLGDLRAAIEDANGIVLNEHGDGIAPNDLVLSRLKRERASLVAAFAPQLIDIALTKLLNEVARRTRKAATLFFQDELFADYPKLPSLISVGRGLKKSPQNLTIREAKLIVERRKKKDSLQDHDDIERALVDCLSRGATDKDTFGMLERRKADSEITSISLGQTNEKLLH